ncbi:MAG: hypothetical protein MZU91_06375 [Desulfosudis oleivorans]|nr:hypothetical protein [Desulfosudis oleivorans]
MLCEGGFSLMETDEMNYQILQNAANALTAEKETDIYYPECLIPSVPFRQRFP